MYGYRSSTGGPKVLARAGLTIDQMDLVELNEAFASQTLVCMRLLEIDPAKVDIYGGAIALGHGSARLARGS